MTGPLNQKGRAVGGVFPNLSDRLDKSGTPGPIPPAADPLDVLQAAIADASENRYELPAAADVLAGLHERGFTLARLPRVGP